MARQAGEFTKAVRKLLEKSNGAMTHTEGRVELAKMGIAIVPEETDRSSPEWKAESNSWNTTAFQWRREHGLSKGRKRRSGKPKSATQSAGSKRRATKRTGTTSTEVTEVTLDQAVEYLGKYGGAKAVQRRLVAIQKELQKLESTVAELQAEQTLHTNALEVVAAAQAAIANAA